MPAKGRFVGRPATCGVCRTDARSAGWHKGWTVLVAIGCLGAFMLVMMLWWPDNLGRRQPTLCRRSKRASLPAAPRTNSAAERQYSLRPPLLPHYVMQNIVYQNIDVINHVEREVQS